MRLIKKILLCITLLVAPLSFAETGQDDTLIDRLGITRSTPLYGGLVFVNGRYLDAPYVVEQRGVYLYVNGFRAGRAIRAESLPGPYDVPLHEDPGMPDDIDENTTLSETEFHPILAQKRQYWATLRLPVDEFKRRHIEYYSSLPNIARAEEAERPSPRSYGIRLRHVDGSTFPVIRLPGVEGATVRPLMESYPRSEAMVLWAFDALRRTVGLFRGNRLLLLDGKGGALWLSAPPAGWDAVFAVLDSEADPEARVSESLRLGLIEADAERHFQALARYFQPTEQLRRRLSGDEDWEAAARAAHEALPSGLVQLPSFAREYEPADGPAFEGDLEVERLGREFSGPVESGYVFVNGQYLDPPYVVEQRGRGIFINDHLCEGFPHLAMRFVCLPELPDPAFFHGHWTLPSEEMAESFRSPVAADAPDADGQLRLRLAALREYVAACLEEDGLIVADGGRLRALHGGDWQREWRASNLEPGFLAYGVRIVFLLDLFLRSNMCHKEALDLLRGHYGQFMVELSLTPGFWLRMAGGDMWEEFLRERGVTIPEGE